MTLRTAVVLSLAFVARGVVAQTPAPKTTFVGDLGYVNTTGNTDLSTLNLDDKIVRSDGRWLLTQVAAYIEGETDHTETANRTSAGLRADYAWAPRFGAFVGASYERDAFAGYNRRVDEIVGVRWRALEYTDDSLSLDGGADFTQQADVNGTNESFPAARAAATYRHTFTKTAYFQQLVEYIPDLKTSGAYRFNTASALVAPLSVHLAIKVGYTVNFNSNPPPTFGTTDRTLTSGVQVTW